MITYTFNPSSGDLQQVFTLNDIGRLLSGFGYDYVLDEEDVGCVNVATDQPVPDALREELRLKLPPTVSVKYHALIVQEAIARAV